MDCPWCNEDYCQPARTHNGGRTGGIGAPDLGSGTTYNGWRQRLPDFKIVAPGTIEGEPRGIRFSRTDEGIPARYYRGKLSALKKPGLPAVPSTRMVTPNHSGAGEEHHAEDY
jgi:hypothetical protein